MNKEDKWIKNWKERLEDYTEPAPEGLWAELENELEVPRRILPFYRRYGAAAAVASVVILSSVALWWHSSTADYVKQISEEIAVVDPLGEIGRLPGQEAGDKPVVAEHPFVQANVPVQAGPMMARAVVSAVTTAEAGQQGADENVIPHSQIEEQKQESTTASPVKEKEQEPVVRRSRYAYDFSSDKEDRRASRVAGRRWEVGLAVGNAPVATNDQVGGYKNLSAKASSMTMLTPAGGTISNAYSQLLARNIDDEVSSRTKHKMPITLGVSVRWHLNDRWSVESGLTYTKLSSEVWSGTERDFYASEQKLHYVGIPVKASYKLWENKLFAFYVSAGGAVEKSVSGKVNTTFTVNGIVKETQTEDLDVKELQWSVSSAVGAQVKLTRHLGLYIEPSLNYYFKDGSSVETIRKEHPLNFNLQTGLRLSY